MLNPMPQVGMEISVGLFFTQYKVVLSAMTLLIVGKVCKLTAVARTAPRFMRSALVMLCWCMTPDAVPSGSYTLELRAHALCSQ